MLDGLDTSRHAEIVALIGLLYTGTYMSYMFRLIFWVLVLLLALSFFGISLQAIIVSPAGQANFSYAYRLLIEFLNWATYWIRPS